MNPLYETEFTVSKLCDGDSSMCFNWENMQKELACSRCSKLVNADNSRHVTEPMFGTEASQPSLSFIQCGMCGAFSHMCVGGQWMSTESALHDNMDNGSRRDGIIQVNSLPDRVVLYLLSQVQYNQQDINLRSPLESSPFLPHCSSELAHVLWNAGIAVGFYTFKQKGSMRSADVFDLYQLPMLDTIYVRSSYRGHGHGTQLVMHFLQQYPYQDVGISQPVSPSLDKVLQKILQTYPEYRDHLWKCHHNGGEGYRSNVWMHLRMQGNC